MQKTGAEDIQYLDVNRSLMQQVISKVSVVTVPPSFVIVLVCSPTYYAYIHSFAQIPYNYSSS